MNTEEVAEHIKSAGVTAAQMLDDIDPKLIKRFKNSMNALDKLIQDIRQHYP